MLGPRGRGERARERVGCVAVTAGGCSIARPIAASWWRYASRASRSRSFGHALQRSHDFEHSASDHFGLFGVVHRAPEDVVGGPVGLFSLCHSGEDLDRCWWCSGTLLRELHVGLADRVGVVGLAAAAERGVELAAIHAGRDDDVGLVDGQSLRSADSGRVGKSDVVGDVVGGEGDPSAVAEVCELEGPAALVDVDHVPAIVVVDPLAGTVGKAAVVASGFDVITDADGLVLDIGVDSGSRAVVLHQPQRVRPVLAWQVGARWCGRGRA